MSDLSNLQNSLNTTQRCSRKKHSCYHSVLSRLKLTSSSSSGSIIGASSNLGEHMGDEDSLFSHSVGPCVPSPVSRKERFSSLMLVWCLTISAGDAVSYSSRSTILLGSGHWAEGGGGEQWPCYVSLHIQ